MVREKGIIRGPHGFRVSVRANGELFQKRFPKGTPLQHMRDWRSRTRFRAEYRAVLARGEERPALRRSPAGWCYLYVIVGDRVCKIGKAVDPEQRLREFRTAHSADLQLVVAVPAHGDLERAAHAQFAHLRVSGEWFQFNDEIAVFVQALQNGRNPIALLWDAMVV